MVDTSNDGIKGNKTVLNDVEAIPQTGQPEVVQNCIFCDIKPDKFDIIMEDEHYVVFSDIRPAARVHLLAIPRRHVFNVKSLHGERGAELVQNLVDIGTRAIQKVDQENQRSARAKQIKEVRMGFHIAPWNTVDHIHLHVLGLPFNSAFHNLKYKISPGDPHATPPTHKGWGWFVTAEQAMAILRSGKEVGVKAC